MPNKNPIPSWVPPEYHSVWNEFEAGPEDTAFTENASEEDRKSLLKVLARTAKVKDWPTLEDLKAERGTVPRELAEEVFDNSKAYGNDWKNAIAVHPTTENILDKDLTKKILDSGFAEHGFYVKNGVKFDIPIEAWRLSDMSYSYRFKEDFSKVPDHLLVGALSRMQLIGNNLSDAIEQRPALFNQALKMAEDPKKLIASQAFPDVKLDDDTVEKLLSSDGNVIHKMPINKQLTANQLEKIHDRHLEKGLRPSYWFFNHPNLPEQRAVDMVTNTYGLDNVENVLLQNPEKLKPALANLVSGLHLSKPAAEQLARNPGLNNESIKNLLLLNRTKIPYSTYLSDSLIQHPQSKPEDVEQAWLILDDEHNQGHSYISQKSFAKLPEHIQDEIATRSDIRLVIARQFNAKQATTAFERRPDWWLEELHNLPNLPSDMVEKAYDMYRAETNSHTTIENVLNHPNFPTSRLQKEVKNEELTPELRMVARENLAANGPDAYHEADPDRNALGSLQVSTKIGKLRQLRDKINQLDPVKGEMQPKKAGNGPFNNSWKPLQEKNGNISAKKIQEYIDSLPKTRFNYSHTQWEGPQRHSNHPQKVFQLNVSDNHVRQMKEAGVYDAFQALTQSGADSGHPVTPKLTIGWVRYEHHDKRKDAPDLAEAQDIKDSSTLSRTGKPHIHIDEIQSDLGDNLIAQLKKHPKRAQDLGVPADKMEKVNQILFQGAHPSETILESFRQYHRQQGRSDVELHMLDARPKSKIANQDTKKELPVHMKETYRNIPKALGFEPNMYGVTQQQDNADLTEMPTWSEKVRKTEEILNKAIKDIKLGKEIKTDSPMASGSGYDFKTYDYNHLLSPILKRAGYELNVLHSPETYIVAELYHKGQQIGQLDARSNFLDPGILKIYSASIGDDDRNSQHRGKGLGTAMYEAVLAHALHNGVKKVTGTDHSSMAHAVHKRLAEKHGLNYRAKVNAGQRYVVPGPYDDKYGDYQYLIKSEDLDKVVLDPSAGYEITHEIKEIPPRSRFNGKEVVPAHKELKVLAIHNGETVGHLHVSVHPDATEMTSAMTEVHPEHRRKGLASAMYAHAEKVTGLKMKPSGYISKDGRMLWEGNENFKQFGKSEETIDPKHYPKTNPVFEDRQLFHGTDASFDKFKTGMTGYNTGTFSEAEPTERHAVFLSDNKDFSRQYGKNLYSVEPIFRYTYDLSHLGTGTPFDDDVAEHLRNQGFSDRELYQMVTYTRDPWVHFDGERGKRFRNALWNAGYDSASFKEEAPGTDHIGTTYAVLHPDIVGAPKLVKNEEQAESQDEYSIVPHDQFVFSDDDQDDGVEFDIPEEDGVAHMLQHEDPVERVLALKSQFLHPHHLVQAITDPHPEVRYAAARSGIINSPLLTLLLEHATDPQTANLLVGHDSCGPEHIKEYLRKFPSTTEEANGGLIE